MKGQLSWILGERTESTASRTTRREVAGMKEEERDTMLVGVPVIVNIAGSMVMIEIERHIKDTDHVLHHLIDPEKTSRARSKSKRKSGFYMGPPTAATVTGSVGQLTDVGGLPPLANKQTIATFFSQVKTSIGGTSAESGRCYHWKHTRAMKKKGSLSCTFSSQFGNYAGGFGASSTLMV